MKVIVYKCPQCSVWVVIPPLNTQQTRAKTFGYCNATFVFVNSELITRQVPNVLAGRNYFKESELN